MTPSGKPPLDEQRAADSGIDPPTPRQAGAHTPSAAHAVGADEPRPIYGAGVPYGGDDRTEEIDPIALDAPFVSDEKRR